MDSISSYESMKRKSENNQAKESIIELPIFLPTIQVKNDLENNINIINCHNNLSDSNNNNNLNSCNNEHESERQCQRPPQQQQQQHPESQKQCFEIMRENLVVHFKNVHFRYKRNEPLIQNLDIHIPAGQIYGLLGPSGCGKSTTLRLILGLIRPQKGNIYVFGCKPNSANSYVPGPGAGYMPQDLALMPTMTVGDHFYFYGALYGMSEREIRKRSAFVIDLLQIPSLERPIELLSGGQQRRTSLALAFMYSPPLLILDEPTVGIDPVMRNKIWDYLHQLTAKENKTVILTTHYIEEARNAHTIALMRYGGLLAETNPDRLLTAFNMSSIEEVFLNLCEKEDFATDAARSSGEATNEDKNIDTKNRKTSAKKQSKKLSTKSNHTFEAVQFASYPSGTAAVAARSRRNTFNILRVFAIILDTFTFMSGKWFTIFVACILPTVQIFLFHFSIGKPILTMPISVFAPEISKSSPTFSDVLIDRLQTRNVQVERHETVNQSIGAVQDGISFASFNFANNFSRCLINRVRKGANAKNVDIECSQVRMSPDNTYQFNIFQLALQLRDSFMEAIYDYFPRLGYNPEALNVPFKVEQYVYGKETFSYQEFMTPGMYMALIYLAPLIVTLFVMLEQKVYGHVERMRAAGARPLEILVAHFTGNAVILVAQTGFMMGTSLIYFESQNLGSIVLLLAIVYMLGVAGICLAILMGAIMQNKLAALVFIYGLTISLWMICGVFWPIQNINFAWFQQAVKFLPLTFPIETARNIMNRGWSWDHQDVLLGFATCSVYCIVPLLFAFIFFK